MPYNGTGTFVRVYNWQDDADANIDILPDRMDGEDDGFATGLSSCITKDGQTVITANIPLNNHKLTGLAVGTAATDSVTLGQSQTNVAGFIAAGGTADVITATFSPSITTLADGMIFRVRASAANATTTPTFSPNGLTARVITKYGNQALLVGDIFGAGHELLLQYHLAGTRYELLNPASIKISTTLQQVAAGLSDFYTTEGTIASATTTDLGSVTTTNLLSVTGTTTITGLGSSATTVRPLYFIRFTGALLLTHNASSLILPGGANITTAAGDTAIVKYEGSGNWRVVTYQKASGQAIVTAATGRLLNIQVFTASATYTPTAGTNTMKAYGIGGGGGGGGSGGAGGAGGQTSLTTLLVLGGGAGGASTGPNPGAAGGTASAGTITFPGSGSDGSSGGANFAGGIGGAGIDGAGSGAGGQGAAGGNAGANTGAGGGGSGASGGTNASPGGAGGSRGTYYGSGVTGTYAVTIGAAGTAGAAGGGFAGGAGGAGVLIIEEYS